MLKYYPLPPNCQGLYKKGDKVLFMGQDAIIEDIKDGTLEIRYMDNTPPKTEFNEDLYLYKVQCHDSCDNTKFKRYIVAEDFDDAWNIAKSYWGDENISLNGIWKKEAVITRSR